MKISYLPDHPPTSLKLLKPNASIRIESFSNGFDGVLTDNHKLIYRTPTHLGMLEKGLGGNTPLEAWKNSYKSGVRYINESYGELDLFVFDRNSVPSGHFDNELRKFINQCHDANPISVPFRANVVRDREGMRYEGGNNETLIDFDPDAHYPILIKIIKQWIRVEEHFNTKSKVEWRFEQEKDVVEIMGILMRWDIALYAAYTSRGKTLIALATAARMFNKGGLVLVTTPISDTKTSFRNIINKYHIGDTRNQKITYIDSYAFNALDDDPATAVQMLRQRADSGELIFLVLTVQDLRYGDRDVLTDVDTELVMDAVSVDELRKKYENLTGNVDLWIRDEFHKEYNAEVTTKRLAHVKARKCLDLTATPYEVLHMYKRDQVVARTLLWGLKYASKLGLPKIHIDGISESMLRILPQLAPMYSSEEGFDPRKLFLRENDEFVHRRELLALRDMFYFDPRSKKKNPLSISNDTDLSAVAMRCGMFVLPNGQDGDSASEYLPKLAELMNTTMEQLKTKFIDSYAIETAASKLNITVGEYVNEMLKKHERVIILTCGKFLTGTDIPPLGHIVLFDKMEKISNFEQLLGRMIRYFSGKTSVKLYNLMPNSSIKLLHGKWAEGSELATGIPSHEFLECVPLSLISADGEPTRPSVSEILTVVNDYYRQESSRKLPSASVMKGLELIDSSLFTEELQRSAKQFSNNTPEIVITDASTAKVKKRVNPKTGKEYTRQELTLLEYQCDLLQGAASIATMVAFSIDSYDVDVVYNDKMFKDLLGHPEAAYVNDVFYQNHNIKSYAQEALINNKKAYGGKSMDEVHDDVFVQQDCLVKAHLVFTGMEAASEVASNFTNTNIGQIAVINANSGSIPFELKKRYPNATITCFEVFPYFKDHLVRCGFVVEYYDEEKIMSFNGKFDRVAQNPPYSKQKWKKFVEKGKNLLKPDGEMISINPYQVDNDKFNSKMKEWGLQSVSDATNYFPTVNSGDIGLFHYVPSKSFNQQAFQLKNEHQRISFKMKYQHPIGSGLDYRECARGTFDDKKEKIPNVKRTRNDMKDHSLTKTGRFTQKVVLNVGTDGVKIGYFDPKDLKPSDKSPTKGRVVVMNRFFGINDNVYEINNAEDCLFSNNVIWFRLYDNILDDNGIEHRETIDSFKSVYLTQLYRFALKSFRGKSMDVQARFINDLYRPVLCKIYNESVLYELAYDGFKDMSEDEKKKLKNYIDNKDLTNAPWSE